MNFLGIGAPEMAIIAVVALLVFGPGKLPEVMGQVGRAIRQFREMTSQLSGEFEKTIAEAQEMGKAYADELGLGDMQKQVNSMTESVRKELSGTTSTSSTSSSSSSTATTTEESKPLVLGRSRALSAMASNTTATHSDVPSASEPIVVASKADPVSDLSLFAPEPEEKPRRVRHLMATTAPHTVTASEPAATNGDGDGANHDPDDTSRQDALERARKRRLAAGYNRHIA
jgi:sec-independent protein translocase protein TatA